MLKKKIKYTDYDGVEREETFLFNLSKAELMEMELGTAGGLATIIHKIINEKDQPSIMKMDAEGHPLYTNFSQTEAYSELFMELATNADAAAAFVKGIMPADVEIKDSDIPEDLKQYMLPEKPQQNNG